MKSDKQADAKSFDKFKQFVEKILAVPKAEIDEKEAEYKHKRDVKKIKKK